MQLKQGLKLGQNLVMTPQLQQAIKLLQLNHMELAELINQELTENPVLEEVGENEAPQDNLETAADGETFDPEIQQQADEASQVQEPVPEEQMLKGKDEVNWDAYLEDFNEGSGSAPSMKETSDETPTYENTLTKTSSLEEHLQWQLSMLNLMENEQKLAQLIIASLNDDGYFEGDLNVLAAQAGIDPEDGEEILKMIQNFDPLGIASRNLKECLHIQARLLNPRQPLVEKIIDDHMTELEKHNIPAIAKALNAPIEQVVEAQKIIHEFEPRPGSLFTQPDTQYIQPDIYIQKVGNQYVIHMNDDGIPRLRVSSYYKSIVQKEAAEGKASGGKTKEYVQEKLRAALWLIRSIQNRQKTIYKVTEAVLARQRDFFEKGSQFLKPMVLKDIASDVGMHESTISRVTTNKYVHTPVGTFELKYFFNSSINSSDGSDALASSAVKEKIKHLVAREDPKKPLSDQQIVDLLSKDNIDIARRTVAKYREMLNILPSSKRKRAF
ncbi:MAG: RNA polymerase factor sigma-54 [Bdellovibrionales bacterium]|nr:RNA polymerase factor sigma-54 [Bdellovibrionales bacterium]